MNIESTVMRVSVTYESCKKLINSWMLIPLALGIAAEAKSSMLTHMLVYGCIYIMESKRVYFPEPLRYWLRSPPMEGWNNEILVQTWKSTPSRYTNKVFNIPKYLADQCYIRRHIQPRVLYRAKIQLNGADMRSFGVKLNWGNLSIRTKTV